MNSHLPVSCEITPLSPVKSQVARVISHPPVISHALRNHTPCDFTSDMCKITASRENTRCACDFTHRGCDFTGGCDFTPGGMIRYDFTGVCDFTPGGVISWLLEITPAPVISHTSVKSHPTDESHTVGLRMRKRETGFGD